MDAIILNVENLLKEGGARICLSIPHRVPGEGSRLHSHHYAVVIFGPHGLDIEPGHLMIVHAATHHKFINVGKSRLKQIDIHVNKKLITLWFEEETWLSKVHIQCVAAIST